MCQCALKTLVIGIAKLTPQQQQPDWLLLLPRAQSSEATPAPPRWGVQSCSWPSPLTPPLMTCCTGCTQVDVTRTLKDTYEVGTVKKSESSQ